MRRPLFIAIIFLLLLRGWAGDLMATGMAAGHLQAGGFTTELIAAGAHSGRAEGHFDHESVASKMMTPLADCEGSGHGSSPAAHAPCEACAACQACHTVALSLSGVSSSPLLTPLAAPHSPLARFASADAAQGQKPPIS